MILFVTISLLTLRASGMSLDGSFSPSPKEWNILKLTQSWPPAVCIFVETEAKKCEIPKNITSWIIHGLWPTETGTEGPNYCNESWKFDVSKVQVLRPRLDLNWPSITFGEKPEDSWDHEWCKHGTCATSLPTLKDELHYFNVTLGLHSFFNLAQFLSKGGISPSDERTYKAEDVLNILQQALGAYPSITCVKEKKTGKFYLEQVEICLTKSLKPTDCESSEPSVVQAHSFPSLHSLLFRPERAPRAQVWQEDVLRSNVHDCGSGGIYYKPMPSK